ncbi:hypothetical protein HNQ91_006064 [Filimonas zeae]|uniref:Uncharacterized protein n=1 Tax=Filimonas zeae TaxID=1737353 RepID=A0A917N1A4_9BACT|nr:hypothetical protein [Filimonas zeae]MDR6342977.1 hypothetical protein [Filimonas zeae]GGH83460.1 hypothetical protein GCM10011379_58880 [Filimonas zeae]
MSQNITTPEAQVHHLAQELAGLKQLITKGCTSSDAGLDAIKNELALLNEKLNHLSQKAEMLEGMLCDRVENISSRLETQIKSVKYFSVH